MAFSVQTLLIMVMVGALSFVALVAILFLFGKLIWLQARVWLLARKGYTQIRHVREDKVERYFYIRVSDGAYKFDGGLYIRQDDATTRTGALISKFNYGLLNDKRDNNEELSNEEREVLKFLDGVKSSRVMDINTLSWGIPTITYFGNNPNPINFAYSDKKYDAKNISALIKRILMTKEWKLVRIVLLLCIIGFFLTLMLGFLDYGIAKGNSQNLGQCLYMLNDSNTKWQVLANETSWYKTVASMQNSTVII